MVSLVDQHGNLLEGTKEYRRQQAFAEVSRLRGQIERMVKAKYDAAQTVTSNENHWSKADNLDPTAANSYEVRRKLRSRSRYEVIENNPYLKGCVLTIGNDFIGCGPKLQITDDRYRPEDRQKIEQAFSYWFEACGLRQKLWRMRIAKLVDGESFLFSYTNDRRKISHRDCPVTLDFFITETDQVSYFKPVDTRNQRYNEVDGLRWDNYNNPVEYHLLDYHPGNNYVFSPTLYDGRWVKADNCIHWFRQDRGWMRGIPETTPSLPLCAMLRRYTLAVVRAAEIAAEFAAILETEGPPGTQSWTDGMGNQLTDEPFDTFPIEMGMFVTMPWGYKMKQLEAKQPMQMYDTFVNALLREITRPLLLPFNLASGTSKDSNMSSGVLDSHIYKGGQDQERLSCNEVVMEHILALWLMEVSRIDGYLPMLKDRRRKDFTGGLRHSWMWDKIGLEHTDPVKVAQAMKIAHDKGFLTDRDIQEKFYSRDVDVWRKQAEEDFKWREEHDNIGMVDAVVPATPAPGANPSSQKKAAAAWAEDTDLE